MQELQRYANMPQKRKLSKEIRPLFQTSKMLHRHCTGDANTELDTSLTVRRDAWPATYLGDIWYTPKRKLNRKGGPKLILFNLA